MTPKEGALFVSALQHQYHFSLYHKQVTGNLHTS